MKDGIKGWAWAWDEGNGGKEDWLEEFWRDWKWLGDLGIFLCGGIEWAW